MFDDEYENEEMTPEEESFSQERKRPSFSDFANSKDAKKLRDTIASGKSKNKNSVPSNTNSSVKDSEEENETENEEEEKPKANNLEKEVATEALKKAAIAAGVPEPLVNAALKTDAAKEAIEKLIEEFKKKKKKIILGIISSALPYLLSIFVVVFSVSIVMAEFYKIVDSVDKGLATMEKLNEKMFNFAQGEGWQTEEEEFFKTLRTENESAKKFNNGQGLNIPLIASTIHYNYMIDIGIYEEDIDTDNISLHKDGTLGSEDSLFDNFIEARETKSFYTTANDKLGKTGFTLPGGRRLIGHMVSPQFTWKTLTLNQAITEWGKFFEFFGKNAPNVGEIILFIVSPEAKIMIELQGILDTAASYAEQGSSGWVEYTTENAIYEIQEIIDYFSNNAAPTVDEDTKSNLSNYSQTGDQTFWNRLTTKGDIFPAPVIEYVYTEEVYKNYLRNIYVPLTYGVGKARNYGNDSDADYVIDTIVDEIFAQADTFDYLFDIDGMPEEDCHYEYKIDDSTTENNLVVNGIPLTKELIDSLKVRVSGETISLEDYIIGVSYAESSGAVNEARKANMIAQQSFLFSRASMTNENGVYIFSIENSSNAQNYCNVYVGCAKRALTEEEIKSYKESYQSIKYQILYDKDANKPQAYYRARYTQCPEYAIGKCMGQRDSYDDEDAGLNYKAILAKYYTQLSLVDVSNGGVLTRSYVCYSSGLIAGNHGDFPIRNTGFGLAYPYNLLSQSNYGECVWYAKGRALEIVSTVSSVDESRKEYIFNMIKGLATGNGNQYCDRLLTLKSEDGTPLFGTSTDYHEVRPGALACYDNYVPRYNGWYGHVIVIEDVQGDQVTISQMGKGFGEKNGYFNTRTYTIDQMNKIPGSTSSYETTKFIRYVYLLD